MTTSAGQTTEAALPATGCAVHVRTDFFLYDKFIISFLFLVALNCGETSSQNNTYFESDGSEVGSCNLKICSMNSNICQVRLVQIEYYELQYLTQNFCSDPIGL